MFELHDYIYLGLALVASLTQIVPIYYGWKVYRLNGYARYWSEAWLLWIGLMIMILVRRGIAALYFCPDGHTEVWILHEIIFTLIHTAGFTVFAILMYKFFGPYFENARKAIEKGG